MSDAKNRKLCWNCEGSVHIQATKCAYCGTDLTIDSSPVLVQSSTDSDVPLPPFPAHTEPEAPEPVTQLAQDVFSNMEDPHEVATRLAKAKLEKEVSEEATKGVILPMLLLLPGAFFLLFGMILLLFSSNGFLTLRWNAHYWTLYFVVAIPLLYLGWRALGKKDPSPQASK